MFFRRRVFRRLFSWKTPASGIANSCRLTHFQLQNVCNEGTAAGTSTSQPRAHTSGDSVACDQKPRGDLRTPGCISIVSQDSLVEPLSYTVVPSREGIPRPLPPTRRSRAAPGRLARYLRYHLPAPARLLHNIQIKNRPCFIFVADPPTSLVGAHLHWRCLLSAYCFTGWRAWSWGGES